MANDRPGADGVKSEWTPRIRSIYQNAVTSRISVRSLPDLVADTRHLAQILDGHPDPLHPTQSVLASTGGELGAELFRLPQFLTDKGGLSMFWVSGDMASLVRHAAQELPSSCLATDAVRRPTPHAMVIFETPVLSWICEDPGLGPVPISGLAWVGYRSPRWDGRLRPAVCMAPLGTGEPFGRRGMVPLSSSYLFPHATLKEHLENERLTASASQRDPNDPGQLESDENRRLFLALSILFESTIVTVSEQRGARAEVRRAERADVPCDVRIVTLRRKGTGSERSDDPAYVEWSHRWIVSGHWRNQAYGKDRAERRLTWVSPYVKGPEDKPLVVRPTVGALVR